MKKITVKLSDALHRKLVNAGLDRGNMSLQDMMVKAAALWLDSMDVASPLSPDTQQVLVSTDTPDVLKNAVCTPQEYTQVERLLAILRSSKPNLADAIRANLEQFADLNEAWLSSERQNDAHAGSEAGAGEPTGVERIDRLVGDLKEQTERADALERELREIRAAAHGRGSKGSGPKSNAGRAAGVWRGVRSIGQVLPLPG